VAPARDPGTVVFASGVDLESANPLVTIHPLSRQVQRHVLFLTLARFDSQMNPEPYLASRWWFSDDRRSLYFLLRQGVLWHDGRPTTAADVAWTVTAARNPASGYPRAADLSTVTRILTPNDSTVQLVFNAAQPFFPGVLCELPILPAHLLGGIPLDSMRAAPFSTRPVGNGPFRFVERVAGRRWVFERNDLFPGSLGGAPLINRLVIAVVDEATTKFAGLVSGELDVAGISPSMAELTERDPRLRVLSYQLLFSNTLVFNVHRPPFDDVRVRRAVSLSVDRARLINVALAGFGVPTVSPVAPGSSLMLALDAEKDTTRADSLLDAAGWTRGSDGLRRKGQAVLEFELLTVVTANNELEQLLQSDLSERGIRMRIRGTEFASFLARARARPKDFDALVTGIPGDLSLAYLFAMFDSGQAGGALDYADYHTPRLDLLFRAVRAAGNEEELQHAWREVQEELAAEVPVAWLYHARGVQGLSRRLAGVTMDLRGELVTVSRWRTDSVWQSPK
jgi:peptide/nickel transport system substrate-binding protein